jgi:hypothetical protein
VTDWLSDVEPNLVSDSEVPVESDTAFEKSALYPTVVVAVIGIIAPAVIAMEKP